MLKLHVLQAEQGDCLLLEWDSATAPGGKPSFILIDGGPDGVYDAHLSGFLNRTVHPGGRLERVMLSHVDDDHINGLLDFLGDMQKAGAQYKVGGLWHNSFSQVVGKDVEDKFLNLVDQRFIPMDADFLVNKDRSIAQGDQLTNLSSTLGIDLNPELGVGGLFTVDAVTAPLQIKGLNLRVVGPSLKNLAKLRKDWLAWLAKREKELAAGITPKALDTSVPNLSSIMLLVELGGKTLLLTGDGRGDHLLQGLKAAKLLKPGGKFHVDVLKLPHHGSIRNATLKFFQTVTADRYVISANGRDGNPDLDTLVWIAQSAKADGRKIEFLITNESESTRQFRQTFDSTTYGYTWNSLPAKGHAITLDMQPASGTQAVTYDLVESQPVVPAVPTTTVSVTRPEPLGGKPSSRRALLVGINDFPKPAWALRGCVNDSLNMQSILKDLYQFKNEEIHLLHNSDATNKRIREEFQWLFSGYAGGDVRVFAFSSHGTQAADQNNDEWEAQDEVIVPYDHSWANPFRDDDLKIIFDQVPDNVNFTYIADCCHSGTINKFVTDQVEGYRVRVLTPPPDVIDEILVRREALQSEADKYAEEEVKPLLNLMPPEKIEELKAFFRNKFRENRFGYVKTERQILLAGCQDAQTSADAFIEGEYRGAFTWALGKAIREANGNLTYEELARNAADKMRKFTQIPQLESPEKLKKLRLFSAIQ